MATSKRWLGVVAVLVAFLLGSGLSEAQVLKARVSVKVILDENGERPVGGRFDDNETIEADFATANRILEANDADWRFDLLLPIIEVAGISQWYGPMPCFTARNSIQGNALANPDAYRWRHDAINVYIGNYIDGSCAGAGTDVVMFHNCVTRECLRAWIPFFAGRLALHEIGHFFDLRHTHGSANTICPGGTPGDDGIDDTLLDLPCWNRDDIASFNFEGSDYAGLTPEEKQQVETVILNTMSGSSHSDEQIELEKSVLSAGQLAAIAAEMDPVTGRRANVLNLPRPAFTVLPDGLTELEEATFNGGLSETEPGHVIESYEWDFGDGETEEGELVNHNYAAPGRYTIRLTVTDDRGLWMISEQTVTVRLSGDVSDPWTALDIGAVTGPGGARSLLEDDCLLVQGAEGTIGGPRDRFYFVAQPEEGNFSLVARIASWQDLSTKFAKVGLMLREGLDEGARHGAVFLQATEPLSHGFLYRSETDGQSLSVPVPDSFEATDLWLRIDRAGDTIQGFVSEDGSSWGEFDAVELPGLADGVHVGVAASGQPRLGLWSVATLCASITRPHFLRGDCNGDRKLDLSDGVSNLNFLFGNGKSSDCVEACNTNDDDKNDIADAVALFNFLFGSGTPPDAPFPACGEDPQPAASLGCERRGCE